MWKDLEAEPPRHVLRTTLRLACLASAQHRLRLPGEEPAAGNTAAQFRIGAASDGAGAAPRSQPARAARSRPGRRASYRVGIQPGNQRLMRWFPPARFRAPAMFLLEPFEGPAVPMQGIYAVVYLDGRGLPLGGPRITLAVEQVDRRLVLTDGDRTFTPRPRSEGGPGALVCQAGGLQRPAAA